MRLLQVFLKCFATITVLVAVNCGAAGVAGAPAVTASATAGAHHPVPASSGGTGQPAPSAHAAAAAISLAQAAPATAAAPATPAAAATTRTTPATATPATSPVLLVFGDSLSAAYGLNAADGWPALLGERLAARKTGWRVVNASISGETTAGGRARLPRTLEEHKPRIVLLELGANDGLRGLPITAMRANLEAMVTMIRKAGALPVIIGMQLPPNFGSDYTREFADVFRIIAERGRLPHVPFLLEGIADRRELFLPDNLHPDKAAQPLVLENVWKVLAPLLVTGKGAPR